MNNPENLKKWGDARRERKKALDLSFSLSKVDVDIICKEFQSLKTASSALGIKVETLKKRLSAHKYNEIQTGLDVFMVRNNPKEVKVIKGLFSEEELVKVIKGNKQLGKDDRNKYIHSLIRFGYKACKCEDCGFVPKPRLVDGALPLLIVFTDNKPVNQRIENITIVCYNCYFNYAGKMGYDMKGKKKILAQKATLLEEFDNQWEVPWQLDNEKLQEVQYEKEKRLENLGGHKHTLNIDEDKLNALKEKLSKNLTGLA